MSENIASNAHVSPVMSRETFGGCRPLVGAHIAPTPLLFNGREGGRDERRRAGREMGGEGAGIITHIGGMITWQP